MSQQINLLNTALIPQKEYIDARMMGLAVMVVAVVMLAAFGYERYQLEQLTRQADRTSQELDAAKATLAQVSAQFGPRQPSESLKQDVATAEHRLKTHLAVRDVLQGAGQDAVTSASEYMRAFARQHLDGVWLNGVQLDIQGGRLSISGRALEPNLVPQYIAQLRAEPALQGKTFASMGISQPKIEVATKPAPGDGSVVAAKPALTYVEFKLEAEPVASVVGGRQP